MEFIIGNLIKIHPMALVRYDELKDKAARKQIAELTRAYEDKTSISSRRWRAAWPGSPRHTIPTR
jgi:GrpB-like predicted nucleotidyltransferase (UPF0157 family)